MYAKSATALLHIWLLLGCLLIAGPAAATEEEGPALALEFPEKIEWYSQNEQGQLRIHFYFFWSKYCPHCQKARPFIEKLAQQYPWLVLHDYELAEHPENVDLYMWMSALMNRDPQAVPGFMFCEQFLVGYDTSYTTGRDMRHQLDTCHARQLQRVRQGALSADAKSSEQGEAVHLPVLGKIDLNQASLPIYTVLIAALDAFNPCAFFVLLFLLSLLVHARSRARMLFIGGVFVFFSGLIYFIFMAAWLNVFLLMGELRVITFIAALLAIAAGAVNVKDFFWFGRGFTLSIPESAKPKLFERMRNLLEAANLFSLALGTVTLAIAANTYELLCTSGFPMVYTRLLTLSELSTATYYGYLAIYNVIYVIPLLVIVVAFTYTLGSRKLREHEGRMLKLMSGLMMLGLGLVLLVGPHWLSNILVAVAIVATALALTFLFHCLECRRNPDLRLRKKNSHI